MVKTNKDNWILTCFYPHPIDKEDKGSTLIELRKTERGLEVVKFTRDLFLNEKILDDIKSFITGFAAALKVDYDPIFNVDEGKCL